MKQRILLSLLLLVSFISVALAKGAEFCVTNYYGEQSSLILTTTSPNNYDVTGSVDYSPYGSTIWPVKGTYNCTTGQLHYVATNPNPDNCTYWANTVTFDYTVSGHSLTGQFSNDCGFAGSLGASVVKGACGYAAKYIFKQGEYGTTGSSKMNRSKLALPKGQNLQELLKGKPIVINVSPNPSKQYTQVSFSLEYATKIQVKIYDQKGNVMNTLVEATLPKGNHTYQWNLKSTTGVNVPHGNYWVRVSTDAGVFSKQIMVER